MAKRPSTQFKPLTVIQEAYCQEYIKSPENQTQAAVNAGYSPKTAAKFASQNMRDERIQKRIAELMAERNKRLKVSADYRAVGLRTLRHPVPTVWLGIVRCC